MANEVAARTRQIKLQQWAAMVKECNSRPSNMSVSEWCKNNGVTKDAYYYRLNKVRSLLLEQLDPEVPVKQQVVAVSPEVISVDAPVNNNAALDISINNAVIHVTENTSSGLLAMVVKVLGNA